MMRLLAGTIALALASGCANKTTPVPLAAPPQDEPVGTMVAVVPAMRVQEAPSAAFTDPERRKKIAAKLPAVRELAARFVADDRLVGLAIGVVVDGELVLGEGFGARHVESGGAVDTRTVFRVGSITKVFTTMTALHLAERGRIALDAPAAELLPELDALIYPGADARRITVRDLIAHTAGLPRDPDLPPLSRDKPTTRAELMQAIDGLSLVRPPGVAHEYSNLGFSLLGHVIAAASERPYHDALDAAILAPLGMKDTVWEPTDAAPERLASGHVIKDGRVIAQPPTLHGALDAAGGLLSTVDDLARFVAFHLAAWSPGADEADAPLSRSTRREAHGLKAHGGLAARTRPTELVPSGLWAVARGVGFGFTVTHECDLPHVVGHNGAVDGHHATIRMLPHAGVGVIVLGNASWADTDRIAEEILHTLEKGGGLRPRAPQASRELTTTARRLAHMLGHWDEAAIAAASTQSLRRNPKRLTEHMQWMAAALGPCTLGPLKHASSPWAGTFRLDCERGRAELSLSLTSAREPMLAGASITWLDGTPTPEVQTAANEVTPLLTAFDAEKYRQLFSPNLQQSRIERLAPLMRFEFGTCRPGKPLEVTGPDAATFELTCDRGTAKLSLSLDRGTPRRIASLRVSPGSSAPACR